MSEKQKNYANFLEANSSNENDPQDSPKSGNDIVPEISQKGNRNEILSPRGGKYNLRPNPNPKYSENFRY